MSVIIQKDVTVFQQKTFEATPVLAAFLAIGQIQVISI